MALLFVGALLLIVATWSIIKYFCVGTFFIFENSNTIKWNKTKKLNPALNYGNNKNKATEINNYVVQFLNNEKICKICQNFVKENYHKLPDIGILELSFLPYIYSPYKNKFILTKLDLKENTLYSKFIKNYSNEYLVTNYMKLAKIHCVRNGYDGGFSAMINLIDKNYINRFDNLKGSKLTKKLEEEKNKEYESSSKFDSIKNLFKLLCNQELILNNNDVNCYHAFIFIIYHYRILHMYEAIELYIKEYGVDLQDSFDDIIKDLYIKNVDESIIGNILAYKSMKSSDFSESFNFNLLMYFNYVNSRIKIIKEKETLSNLLAGNYTNKVKVRIEEIDLMSGEEFEFFITQLFTAMGYKTTHTKLSGDQGVDVIAEKDNIKIVIQTKCYHNVVGNKAIQEAVAGMKYYDADKAMVITNSIFTRSAIELAQKNNVQLWDRKILIEKIDEVM